MRARPLLSADSYGLVLALVGITYVVATTAGSLRQPAGILLQIVTAFFALRTSQASRRVRTVAFVVLACACVAVLVSAAATGRTASAIADATSAVLYLLTPIVIIRHLATRPGVDLQTLLGAVAAYLMVGMLFAFSYELFATTQDAPFFGPGNGDGTPADIFFFSFTTLTTTGYGNLVPAGDPGRTLAVAEMLIGQLFLVTVVAKVVGAWVPRR